MKRISDSDAKYIADLIATQAAQELEKRNPVQMMRNAGLSINTFNHVDEDRQKEMLATAQEFNKIAFSEQFEAQILENPEAFFTQHTQLFDQAELELEEYLFEDQQTNN